MSWFSWTLGLGLAYAFLNNNEERHEEERREAERLRREQADQEQRIRELEQEVEKLRRLRP